eukprot:20970-Eustigmatos_ZCMA.PRE.1
MEAASRGHIDTVDALLASRTPTSISHPITLSFCTGFMRHNPPAAVNNHDIQRTTPTNITHDITADIFDLGSDAAGHNRWLMGFLTTTGSATGA